MNSQNRLATKHIKNGHQNGKFNRNSVSNRWKVVTFWILFWNCPIGTFKTTSYAVCKC